MFFNCHFSQSSKILKTIFNDAFYFNQHEDFIAPIFLSNCKIKK